MQTYKNGDKFVGQLSNNKKNGRGTSKSHNGMIYDGDYKDDERHGYGIEKDQNGNKY